MKIIKKLKRSVKRFLGLDEFAGMSQQEIEAIRARRRAHKQDIEKSFPWNSVDKGVRARKYNSYNEYVEHQRSKLDAISHDWLPKYDKKYRKALASRLASDELSFKSLNVLCLAARIGTEVKAFQDQGAFAIGLDLNPGEDNRYVLPGDFHNIQFPDESVDVVFCNSIDHAYNLEKLIAEIKRVLKSEGLLIIEIGDGDASTYESLSWSDAEDVLSKIQSAGFREESKKTIEFPWPGHHVIMKKS